LLPGIQGLLSPSAASEVQSLRLALVYKVELGVSPPGTTYGAGTSSQLARANMPTARDIKLLRIFFMMYIY
jgi:hypothetical protein